MDPASVPRIDEFMELFHSVHVDDLLMVGDDVLEKEVMGRL